MSKAPANQLRDKIRELISSVEILRVDLQKSSCQLYVPSGTVDPKATEVQEQRSFHWELDKTNSILACAVSSEIVAFPAAGNAKEKFFEIACTHVAFYSGANESFGKQAFDFFAQNNAAFNVHPYAREFLDGVSRRMGLAPVVLPLLKPEQPSESTQLAALVEAK